MGRGIIGATIGVGGHTIGIKVEVVMSEPVSFIKLCLFFTL